LGSASAKLVNFESVGGIPDDKSWDAVLKNGALLNQTLNSLQHGDEFLLPAKTFYTMGGLVVSNLSSVRIRIDGTLTFGSTFWNGHRYLQEWPRDKKRVLACMSFSHLTNVTFTSSTEGELDGEGAKWWGLPGIGYLVRGEDRPRLLKVSNSRDVVVEHLFFKDSPYWTFLAQNVKNLVVRYSRVEVRRTKMDSHDIIDLTAFNTDGFDMAHCNGVHIHDCAVWNQDDCFDVKDGTQNVLIERVNASGVGLTIGSIASTVRNITFRDAYMHHTMKGIYMKFRGQGSVSDVLYENIVMDEPEQWAIWIGGAQQCDGCGLTNICSAQSGTCSICWPGVPGTECNAPIGAQYSNITLRNITINSPKKSAGVLIANASTPMENVVFDNVVVNNPGSKPWGEGYFCKHVNGVATGNTYPVPACFMDKTTQVSAL